MPQPSNSTVIIDNIRFNALTLQFGVSTHHDHTGMPQMGTTYTVIDCTVDMHDTGNLPYANLQRLFELSHTVTRDKIKPVRLQFWQDENQTDAVCTYAFDGWISSYMTGSGGGGNHTLSLTIQPALDQKSFINITMGN